MATRKRLSDLLREEAQRPDEADTTAKPAAKPASNRAKAKGMARPAASKEAAKPEATPIDPPAEQNGHGEIDALKEALADLQTKLEEARAQEGILQRQIETLQNDLKERDTTVQQLQTELRGSDQLRKELEDAKQMIRGLTEQRQAEEAARKAAPAPAQVAPAPAAPVAAAPAAPAPTPAPAPAEQPGVLRRQAQVSATTELWRVLQHPVAIEIPSTQLSNDDIGWVD